MMRKIIILVCLSVFAGQDIIWAQKPVVFTMKIDDQIDPRMNRYTELALNQAISDSADYVIIEMDTYGGAVNDADDIRTRIMEFEKPIYVFINKDAASAGALISIACDSIYMAPGSSIGAATVVVGGSGEAAPDKYQSYMRSMMRSTAEAKGRDPKIAEAMVDQSIEIEGITKAGQVLTFSTSEAIENGYCEAEVKNIEELLSRLDITDYQLIKFELSGIEKIIRFFLNPMISGLLILIIVGGIYFELQTPGVGFPIIASFTALILYFVPYYLTGLADHWEIALFFVGVGLLALEIFVIPGFGIAGITGLVFTLGSLVLVMLNNDALDFTFVQMDEVFVAISTTLAGLLGAIIVMMFGGIRLTSTAFFKRISLQDVQLSTEGFTSKFPSESLQGKTGTTYTVLRPSGKVLIDGNIYDAYTRGDFIDSGKEIIVIEESGTSLKVKEKTI
ncbi:MAG: nodulation protein NfeD [Cyclobacteriaceae bacterium]|nr:nodulation protein NfeD [Cyclobacteriaceae bacterium]